MASVNKVIILGNLGADPEARSTATGQTVVNFNVATNERWKNKATGQPEERTEWHKAVVWGREGGGKKIGYLVGFSEDPLPNGPSVDFSLIFRVGTDF